MTSVQGDSGGPLFITKEGQYQLIGVFSYLRGCGKAFFPSIFTRYLQTLKFLFQNIKWYFHDYFTESSNLVIEIRIGRYIE